MKLRTLVLVVLCFIPVAHAERPANMSDLKDCEKRLSDAMTASVDERKRLWQAFAAQGNDVSALGNRITALETNAQSAAKNRDWLLGIGAVLLGNLIWTFVIHQKGGT